MPNVNHFRILIQKESYKFSATHFTVFNSTEAERLHGHNYSVSVECHVSELGSLGMGFEFNHLKPHIKATADRWDERVLLAGNNPHMKLTFESIRGVQHQVVDFSGRSYRFPADEVSVLAVSNITSEELAREFANHLVSSWQKAMTEADQKILSKNIQWIEIGIEETRGQKAIYHLDSPFSNLHNSMARGSSK